MHWFSEFNNFTAYISDIVWGGVDNISPVWCWSSTNIKDTIYSGYTLLYIMETSVWCCFQKREI